MNPQLSALIELQEVNLRIYELGARLKVIPDEQRALEEVLERAKEGLEAVRSELGDQEKGRRQAELQVEALREQLTKYKTQQIEVKSNEAYQALLHEIAYAEQEITRAEDLILDCMLAVDDQANEVSRAEQELKSKEAEVSAGQEELRKSGLEAEAEITELKETKLRLLDELPGPLKGLYARIAKARGGTVLAEARDQSCQVCHVKLRPQLFSEIKLNRQIITCESCSRILYFAGKLG
jgi:predicted  nucleic acid-binding Zn-ribbon protein